MNIEPNPISVKDKIPGSGTGFTKGLIPTEGERNAAPDGLENEVGINDPICP